MKTTPLHYDTFATPLGTFSAAVDEGGAVVATAFGGLSVLKERLRKGTVLKRDEAALREVREAVAAYFDGKAKRFPLRLAPQGTPFQQTVWKALLAIPFGKTLSYKELAEKVGKPTASRAVGGANGANPICLLVPCHRVIGADGSLTGFAFGTAIKKGLLEHEGALP